MRKKPRFSREARRKIRAAIAQAVRDGERPCEVAERFGSSARTVTKACRENGVPAPTLGAAASARTAVSRFDAYELIAALFDRSQGIRQIARRFGITHQSVGRVYRKCVKAGIPVPRRPASWDGP
jgi:DNA invertase Pin-like site-specific DNA recombinase